MINFKLNKRKFDLHLMTQNLSEAEVIFSTASSKKEAWNFIYIGVMFKQTKSKNKTNSFIKL